MRRSRSRGRGSVQPYVVYYIACVCNESLSPEHGSDPCLRHLPSAAQIIYIQPLSARRCARSGPAAPPAERGPRLGRSTVAANFMKTGRVFDAYRPSIIISSEVIGLVGCRPHKAEESRMPGSNEHAQKSMAPRLERSKTTSTDAEGEHNRQQSADSHAQLEV